MQYNDYEQLQFNTSSMNMLHFQSSEYLYTYTYMNRKGKEYSTIYTMNSLKVLRHRSHSFTFK